MQSRDRSLDHIEVESDSEMEDDRRFVSAACLLLGRCLSFNHTRSIFHLPRITEAQNECRDKMKFLESIRRYLENLTEDAHPQNCAVNILPALCDAMRTVESVSRYYARLGYLGLIFSKVTDRAIAHLNAHALRTLVSSRSPISW